MQKFIKIIFFIVNSLLLTPIVFASEPDIKIDSFEVVHKELGSVIIKVSGINKASNSICFTGVAKSSDGLIQSLVATPLGAEYPDKKSGKFTALVSVYSPSRTEAIKTDILLLKVTVCDIPQAKTIANKEFDWPYSWEPTVTKIPFRIFHAKIISKEFKTLERLLDKWNSSKERNKDGHWKLSEFTGALWSSCYVGNTANWERCFKRIEYWKTVSPKVAGLAEAKYWVDYAWHVRGGRYAKGVDSYAMKLFLERMKKGELALEKVESIKSTNPLWYELYLAIAIDADKDRELITKLFDEAIKQHPAYLPLYSKMVSYLADIPKAQNEKEVDNLINTATAYTYEEDADSNYARLYSKLIYTQQYSKSIFHSSLVSWPKMKKSFETMIAQYPSPGNLNRFAILACQANDKNTFLTLWPKIEKKLKPKLWPHNYSIDLCKHKLMKTI